MLPEEQDFLDHIYHENFIFLYKLSLKLLQLKGIPDCQRPDLAEELVQDTFKTASQRIEILKNHPNPVGWLVNVAKKKSLEFSRRAESDRQRLLLIDAQAVLDMSSEPSAQADPSEELEYCASLDIIRETLSEEEFRLFDMVILRHMTHLAASEELGISLATSQKRVQRIREKLHKIQRQLAP